MIIGGRSRKSKLLGITMDEASLLEICLQDEGRDSALDLLQLWGYDTGERNHVEGNYGSTSVGSEESPAAQTKWDIDSGRRSPDYDGCLKVSCRLLRTEGWQGAWDWLQRTLGEDFDARDTYDRLKAIVEAYEAYEDVAVPPKGEALRDGSGIEERSI